MSEITPQAPDSTLAYVLHVLRSRWAIVLLFTVVAPVAAYAASKAETVRYSAQATLLFRDPGFDDKVVGTTLSQPTQGTPREAQTNLRLVSQEGVAQRAAELLGGRFSADEIRGAVEVMPAGESDLVEITATTPSPRHSAAIATAFAKGFISIRRDSDRSSIKAAQQLVRQRIATSATAQQGGTSERRTLKERADQLELLAALQTGNAELVGPAKVPTSPSFPRTRRNVLLGFLFGMLAGVALAFAKDILDTRVRNPSELEALFGRPLLGIVPRNRVLRADSPGVPEVIEPFSMLRANIRYLNVDRRIESVIVTSADAGEGKSTVALNLAAASAAAGTKVLLVDGDLRHPTVASRLGLQASPGLSELIADQLPLEAVVQRARIGDGPEERGFDVVVSGGIPPNPTDLTESESMRRFLEGAKHSYEFLVVDSTPLPLVPDALPLLPLVSGAIVVVRMGRATRSSVVRLYKQLEALEATTLGVVANQSSSGETGYGYGYGYYGQPKSWRERWRQRPLGKLRV